MASRKIVASAAVPIRRLNLNRFTKQSPVNVQDRLLPPLFCNPNREDRHLLGRRLNHGALADSPAIAHERFGPWLSNPVGEEQTGMSDCGPQIRKEDCFQKKDETATAIDSDSDIDCDSGYSEIDEFDDDDDTDLTEFEDTEDLSDFDDDTEDASEDDDDSDEGECEEN